MASARLAAAFVRRAGSPATLYVDTRHKHTCAEVRAQHPNFMPAPQAESAPPPLPVDPQAAAAAARAAEDAAKRNEIESKFRSQLNDIVAKDAEGRVAASRRIAPAAQNRLA